MAEKDFIIEEKTTEETKEEVKEETPLEDVVLETEDGTKSLLGATMGTGDIAATSLDTKTTPAGTDNLILFNQNTNVGYQIDYDNLADAILNKITSKTYANQVGGSSGATLLAQLSTLNSNMTVNTITPTIEEGVSWNGSVVQIGKIVIVSVYVHGTNEDLPPNTALISGLPYANKAGFCLIGNASGTSLVGIPSGTTSTFAGKLYTLSNLTASWTYGVLVYTTY